MLSILQKKLLSTNPGFCGLLYAIRKTFLTKTSRKYFSQFGEDIILENLLDPKYQGFYVDVGCYHPKKFSNTYMLYKRGWHGINVDLNPLKIKAFNLARPKDHNIVAAIASKEKTVSIYHDGIYSLGTTLDKVVAEKSPDKLLQVEQVKTRTLNSVLQNSPFKDKKIDLLTIDAEGCDFDVLISIDLDFYCPKIILIETHLKDIKDVLASDLFKFLSNKEYHLANWVGYTLFFLHKDSNNLIKN